MDQPSIDGINTWFAAKAAREVGLKVVFSGLGGDELLGGYPSFKDVPAWRRRFGIPARIPFLGCVVRRLLLSAGDGLVRRKPKAAGMLEYADSWERAYFLRRSLFLPYELRSLVDPNVVRDGMRRLKPLRLLKNHIVPDPGSANARICALESAHYMRNQLLRDADWAGMAHSLEIRVPFVDVALLKAISSYLPMLNFRQGKAALSRAPARGLPAAVVERSKTGFVIPTAYWLRVANGEEKSQTTPLPKGLASRSWSTTVLKQSPAACRALLKSAA